MNVKKASLLVSSVLALTAVAGAANAIPTTWSDTYNVPLSQQLVSGGESITFTQDITDGPNGYRPGIDSLTKLVFSFDVADDKESLFTYELGNIAIDAVSDLGFTTTTFVSTIFGGLNSVDPLTVNTHLTLWDTGKYDITVSSLLGDFVVKSATLEAYGDRSAVVTSVPEPTTLALMGIGLLGVGLTGRRRRAQ
ncbi:MAG TPA: PEP-CTERM sorting domain-containing protein [Steroidobacteraceae bacterium]|jgi:hypothetical protein